MKEVAIITDSIAAIPPEVAKKYDILVLPYHIIMDGKDYLETEIDEEQLYSRVRTKENLPTSSAPSPAEFLESFRGASQRAKAILFVPLTSALSQAYNSALNAKQMAQEQLPNTAIEVLDSLTASGAEALIVIEAAKAANEGRRLAEVTEVANKIKQRVSDLALRPTLFHFAEAHGRAEEAKDWAKAAIATATVLEIGTATSGASKPILRDRTFGKAVEATLDLIEERTKGKRLHAAICHVNVPDEAEKIKEKLLSRFDLADEIYIHRAMPLVAMINGEGMIDIGFFTED